MEKTCKFCQDLFDFKNTNEECRNFTNMGLKFKYSVCLVEETIKDGSVRSTLTWKKRKLKYCPSCGRKLCE